MNKNFWIAAAALTVAFAIALFAIPGEGMWIIFVGYGLLMGLAFTMLHSQGRRARSH